MKSRDVDAVAAYKKFNKIPMPDQAVFLQLTGRALLNLLNLKPKPRLQKRHPSPGPPVGARATHRFLLPTTDSLLGFSLLYWF